MRGLWQLLRSLEPGDRVPETAPVLRYADGSNPEWVVRESWRIHAGGRRLLLVDRSASLSRDVALIVLTWPGRTLRTDPYFLATHPRKCLRPVVANPRVLEASS